MGKNEIVNIVRQYAQLVNSSYDVDKVILFGSRLRGDATEESDIDVAVILNNIASEYFGSVVHLWQLRRKIDPRIEPRLFIKTDQEPSGFLEEIKKTGVEIPIN